MDESFQALAEWLSLYGYPVLFAETATRAGPTPALVRRMAEAISSRSSSVSTIDAAEIQPSTCFGVRAPTIAPVTPGHESVHAHR